MSQEERLATLLSYVQSWKTQITEYQASTAGNDKARNASLKALWETTVVIDSAIYQAQAVEGRSPREEELIGQLETSRDQITGILLKSIPPITGTPVERLLAMPQRDLSHLGKDVTGFLSKMRDETMIRVIYHAVDLTSEGTTKIMEAHAAYKKYLHNTLPGQFAQWQANPENEAQILAAYDRSLQESEGVHDAVVGHAAWRQNGAMPEDQASSAVVNKDFQLMTGLSMANARKKATEYLVEHIFFGAKEPAHSDMTAATRAELEKKMEVLEELTEAAANSIEIQIQQSGASKIANELNKTFFVTPVTGKLRNKGDLQDLFKSQLLRTPAHHKPIPELPGGGADVENAVKDVLATKHGSLEAFSRALLEASGVKPESFSGMVPYSNMNGLDAAACFMPDDRSIHLGVVVSEWLEKLRINVVDDDALFGYKVLLHEGLHASSPVFSNGSDWGNRSENWMGREKNGPNQIEEGMVEWIARRGTANAFGMATYHPPTPFSSYDEFVARIDDVHRKHGNDAIRKMWAASTTNDRMALYGKYTDTQIKVAPAARKVVSGPLRIAHGAAARLRKLAQRGSLRKDLEAGLVAIAIDSFKQADEVAGNPLSSGEQRHAALLLVVQIKRDAARLGMSNSFTIGTDPAVTPGAITGALTGTGAPQAQSRPNATGMGMGATPSIPTPVTPVVTAPVATRRPMAMGR